MSKFEKQLNYWTHMLDESMNENVDEVLLNEDPTVKMTTLAGDKEVKAMDAVIDDCIGKYVTSNDDNYNVDFSDNDASDYDEIEFTVTYDASYHKGSYSYHATSDLDYYGYGEEDESYVEIKPSDRMQLDRWMDDRGLAFELEDDIVDSDTEIIDEPGDEDFKPRKFVRYTDKYVGKLTVVDQQKAIDWINSL